MDFMTIFGLVGGFGVLYWGVKEGGSVSAFINLHGVMIVCGGTFFAAMINSSAQEMRSALRAGLQLFASHKVKAPEEMIPIIVELCRKARQGGVRAIQDAGAEAGDDGFMGRVIDACLVLNDERLARDAVIAEINQVRTRHRETGNIFRVMGLLAPMFGLLGTLIGIIAVLRNLSDASQAGPAMAVAISSAFYGIVLSNLVCVPAANKLRSRSMTELLSKEVVLIGILTIVFSSRSPMAVEAGLSGYLHKRIAGRSGEGVPSPAEAV